jgi:hypothetical protein
MRSEARTLVCCCQWWSAPCGAHSAKPKETPMPGHKNAAAC